MKSGFLCRLLDVVSLKNSLSGSEGNFLLRQGSGSVMEGRRVSSFALAVLCLCPCYQSVMWRERKSRQRGFPWSATLVWPWSQLGQTPQCCSDKYCRDIWSFCRRKEGQKYHQQCLISPDTPQSSWTLLNIQGWQPQKTEQAGDLKLGTRVRPWKKCGGQRCLRIVFRKNIASKKKTKTRTTDEVSNICFLSKNAKNVLLSDWVHTFSMNKLYSSEEHHYPALWELL